jgi:prepilin-type N-terminal cleavage/methylation domain-containing protein
MMRTKQQRGLTLIEITVVMAIIAILTAVIIPAIRALSGSFGSAGAAKTMVEAALSSARTIAMREQHYAGVRFQKAYHPEGPLQASQYLILIIHDPDGMKPDPNDDDFATGFRAVVGVKPIKLPDTVGIMDRCVVTDRVRSNPSSSKHVRIDDPNSNKDKSIDEAFELSDVSTFSIVFSPSGNVVVYGLRVGNRNGIRETVDHAAKTSDDSVFNKRQEVESDQHPAMFLQDDYFEGNDQPELGFGPENSRTDLVIYNRELFQQAFVQGRAWTDYLVDVKPLYVGRNTATLFEASSP